MSDGSPRRPYPPRVFVAPIGCGRESVTLQSGLRSVQQCRGGHSAQLRRPTPQRTTRPGTSREPTATTASTARVDRERISTW